MSWGSVTVTWEDWRRANGWTRCADGWTNETAEMRLHDEVPWLWEIAANAFDDSRSAYIGERGAVITELDLSTSDRQAAFRRAWQADARASLEALCSGDAHRVAAIADKELAAWDEFIADVKTRARRRQ